MKTSSSGMSGTESRIAKLSYELLRYCGPIFVAPALNSYPKDMIGNGTFALIDTGQKRILVTCCHVWDEYQRQHDAERETILAMAMGEGDSCFAFKNPEEHLIIADRDLDLAVFEFAPQGDGIRRDKSWFKITDWPISKATRGEYVVTLGFPGAWRFTSGTECKFACAAIPLAVTDTTDRTIAAFSDGENRQVLDDMKDSLAGISGSPAYQLARNGKLRLIGFARVGPSESSAPDRKYRASPGSPLPAVFFTHASFLQPDGKLAAASGRM
jgi:hypothetical protein